MTTNETEVAQLLLEFTFGSGCSFTLYRNKGLLSSATQCNLVGLANTHGLLCIALLLSVWSFEHLSHIHKSKNETERTKQKLNNKMNRHIKSNCASQ